MRDYGAKEHSVDYGSALVNKTKKNYTQQRKKIKPTAPIKKHAVFQSVNGLITTVGTSFQATKQSFQNSDDDMGVSAFNKTLNSSTKIADKALSSSVTLSDKATQKTVLKDVKINSQKQARSRFFKSTAKTSDSVAFTSRKAKSVTASKSLRKKGVSALKEVANPLVEVANNSDDLGAQAMIRAKDTAHYTVNFTKKTATTTKNAVKATGKTAKKTAQTTKKAAQISYKAAQATAKATQAAARVVAETTKAVAATTAKVVAAAASNPVGLIAILIGLLIILIVPLCGSLTMGATSASSYQGTGTKDDLSWNDYSATYDYCNKAIAEKNLELLNLQDTWTGFLEYNYKYKKINDDGSVTTYNSYPGADVAPIMAYLTVQYQSYSFDDTIRNMIDIIVSNLYTFDYDRAPCRKTDPDGTVITGEKITFTVTCHSASKYFEENHYLSQDKMSYYAAVRDYGDKSFFKLQNIFKTENWHNWVSEPYGYSISTTYNYRTERYDYKLITQDYTKLEYKNINNQTMSNLYAPFSGNVVSITEDDNYDYVIKLTDDSGQYDFIIMAEFAAHYNNKLSTGTHFSAGQLIATRDYPIFFKTKFSTHDENPMLLMEYYQHAG